MKEFKGTRGKWYMSNDTGGLQVHSTRFPAGIDIISLMFPQFHDEQTKANAQLIAAAPELLNALQALMDGVANLPPLTAIEGALEKQYKQAEKAINKALGL